MTPDPTSLDRLHDIVEPSRVPWWPPAPGWYYLFALLLLGSFALAVRAFIRWQTNRYRREALVEWQRLQLLLADPSTRAEALSGLAEVLKRTALSVFPRRQVAGLSGEEWLAFLDRTGKTDSFSTPAGRLLEGAAYDPRLAATASESEVGQAASITKDWLADHHRPC